MFFHYYYDYYYDYLLTCRFGTFILLEKKGLIISLDRLTLMQITVHDGSG